MTKLYTGTVCKASMNMTEVYKSGQGPRHTLLSKKNICNSDSAMLQEEVELTNQNWYLKAAYDERSSSRLSTPAGMNAASTRRDVSTSNVLSM